MSIVPLRVDETTVVYIEVDPVAPSHPQGPRGEGGLQGAGDRAAEAGKEIAESWEKIGDTIVSICRSLHAQVFVRLGDAAPKNLETEFALKLAGETNPVPLFAKLSGAAEFKIKAVWEKGAGNA